MEHFAPAAVQAVGHRLRRMEPLKSLLGLVRDGALAYILSAAALGASPIPICMGFIANCKADWSSLVGAMGAALGYFQFWGGQASMEPLAGIIAVLLGTAIFAGTELRERSWFLPALCAGITAALGFPFLLNRPTLPAADLIDFCFRALWAGVGAVIFQDPPIPSMRWGAVILGLCQVSFGNMLDCGVAMAALGVSLHGGAAGLPWALCCGLAIDLSGITKVMLTPVLCLSLLTESLSGKNRRRRALGPALWSVPFLYLAGSFELMIPISLAAGGLVSVLMPVEKKKVPRPSPQITRRLEQAAESMEYLESLLSQDRTPVYRGDVFLEQVIARACQGCSRREQCWIMEGEENRARLKRCILPMLERRKVQACDMPDEFRSRCRRPDGMLSAMCETMEEMRLRLQYEARQRESRKALEHQYAFLAWYLREAAQGLFVPRDGEKQYKPELGIGSRGKFGPNDSGDAVVHFPGPGSRYYVVLCDGMGAGVGAARESERATEILQGMLQAGYPAKAALETLNDLYVLRDTGGFSTADLLELHLDTGRGVLYKWGAAASFLKHRHAVRLLGTAAPPPGVGIGETHRAEVIRLSLQRQEVVVLVSDGLEGEETQTRIADYTGQSTKALASMLVAGPEIQEDDQTAVAVCLRPLSSTVT